MAPEEYPFPQYGVAVDFAGTADLREIADAGVVRRVAVRAERDVPAEPDIAG